MNWPPTEWWSGYGFAVGIQFMSMSMKPDTKWWYPMMAVFCICCSFYCYRKKP